MGGVQACARVSYCVGGGRDSGAHRCTARHSAIDEFLNCHGIAMLLRRAASEPAAGMRASRDCNLRHHRHVVEAIEVGQRLLVILVFYELLSSPM